MRDLNPDQPVEDIATLARIRSDAIAPQRLNATLVAVLALAGLTIAVVGVAGVVSSTVSQRTRELGIRAALGVRRSSGCVGDGGTRCDLAARPEGF